MGRRPDPWVEPRIWTVLVYVFMFLPVAVVVLLSFNASSSAASR